jgi:hypothetical protein
VEVRIPIEIQALQTRQNPLLEFGGQVVGALVLVELDGRFYLFVGVAGQSL